MPGSGHSLPRRTPAAPPPPACAVRSLTAERLARGIREGLAGLRSYTAEAEGLAFRMAGEDGVAAAAALIERLAVEG